MIHQEHALQGITLNVGGWIDISDNLNEKMDRNEKSLIGLDVDSLTDEQISQLFPKILDRYKKITEKPDLFKLHHLKEEIKQLAQFRNSLQNDVIDLENKVHVLEQKLLETDRISRELAQQKIILDSVSTSFENKVRELEKSRHSLEETVQKKEHQSAEAEQAKLLLTEITKDETSKRKFMQKKYYITFVLCAMILTGTVTTFILYEKMRDEQRERILSGVLKGKFLVKNLKGETIDTWATWNLADSETLYITISNPEKISQNKIDVVKDTILSMDTMKIDNAMLNREPAGLLYTYYKGWKGALEEAANTNTEFYIPENIEVSESDIEGDIVIRLTNDLDMDGNAGYTNSIVDQNKILHSTITVYLAEELTDERLSTVVRHEFGHALGLGHSTDPEDLMAPVTATKYPYVSECDINALISLYNNGQSSEIICQNKVK